MINKESNDKKTLKSPVILRRIICILCVLLVLSGAGLVVVSAAPGSGDSPTLELYKRHASDNEAFDVSNMVPGDKVTKDFTVRIHHNDPLTLYFKTEVTEQTKKLGDVLQVSVTDEASGETVCRGTFAELDGVEFSQAITGSAGGSTDVTYRVDAWLDTSVGNEYQQALLKADLYWYVKDDGGHTEPTEPSQPTTPTTPTKPGGGDKGDGGLTANTGDTMNLVLWTVFAACALAIIILLIKSRIDRDRNSGSGGSSNGSQDDPNSDEADAAVQKKLHRSMLIAVLLALMLIVTTFALITSIVSVKDNTFETGIVRINLNDGEPVIRENEYLFEPGMRVQKHFFIKNEGSIDAYYKVYMEDVTGDLADVLQLTITDDESGKVLYQGTADELTRGSAAVSDDIITAGESKNLTILFYFPKERGNEAQDKNLSFRMSATATQVRNNPGHAFE